VAAALTFVTYVDALTPVLPLPARRDPAARAYGWDAVATAVARDAGPDTVRLRIAADRYQDASELAFHMPGHPRTLALNIGGRPNQYDLWPQFAEIAARGSDLLVLLDDVRGVPEQIVKLAPHFAAMTRGDSVALGRAGDVIKYFRLWRFRGWRGTWPEAALRSRS
jgi:hypothetical protein